MQVTNLGSEKEYLCHLKVGLQSLAGTHSRFFVSNDNDNTPDRGKALKGMIVRG